MLKAKKAYQLIRTISLVLIAAFIALDISWVYPSDANAQNSMLATPDLLQSRPVTAEAAAAQKTMFNMGSLLGSVCSVGKLLEEHAKVKHIAGILKAELKELAKHVDLDHIHAVVVVGDSIKELEPDKRLPRNAIIHIPYGRDGKEKIDGEILLALKDNPSMVLLPGTELPWSDRYIIKDLPKGKISGAVPDNNGGPANFEQMEPRTLLDGSMMPVYLPEIPAISVGLVPGQQKTATEPIIIVKGNRITTIDLDNKTAQVTVNGKAEIIYKNVIVIPKGEAAPDKSFKTIYSYKDSGARIAAQVEQQSSRGRLLYQDVAVSGINVDTGETFTVDLKHRTAVITESYASTASFTGVIVIDTSIVIAPKTLPKIASYIDTAGREWSIYGKFSSLTNANYTVTNTSTSIKVVNRANARDTKTFSVGPRGSALLEVNLTSDALYYVVNNKGVISLESFNLSTGLPLKNINPFDIGLPEANPRSMHFEAMGGTLLDIITSDGRMVTFDVAGKLDTAQEFINSSFKYFISSNRVVDHIFGYPYEGYNQKNYTQPTAIGFYAQLLANVVSGDIVTSYMTQAKAITALNKMMTSLVADQKTLGYKGLMPWISFNGKKRIWQRDSGPYGQQVSLGDNVNLSASLGTAIGALLKESLSGNAAVQGIIQKISAFLDAQQEGYNFLYNSASGHFRHGWNFVDYKWLEEDQDYFGDEARSGILFVMFRYGFPDSVYDLDVQMKDYTMSDGQTVYTVAPYDGSAFQMLWPTLTMPETLYPASYNMLQNFVNIALDFSAKNNLPGFLSACYVGPGQYAGNVGIGEISANLSPRNEDVASLYTLGAAHMVEPLQIESFLENILTSYPGLVTSHGLWEGVDMVNHTVVQEQVSSNVDTFILGMAGTGPAEMIRYLETENLYTRFQSVFTNGGAIDLIGSSTASFTWGDGASTSQRSGSAYIMTSTAFTSNGTAFMQNGVNLSGGQLTIKYNSTTPVGNGRIELKDKDVSNNFNINLSIEAIPFENTSGAEREITVDLPITPALFNIDQVALVLSGGNDGPLDMTIIGLSLVGVQPTGLITINNNAAYTASRDITLSLDASDTQSAISGMRFSTDAGVTWTAFEAFSPTKSLALPVGDGTKEVRCQVKDNAGSTATFTDTIILDTTAPTGSISVNNDAEQTTSKDVMINITASDAVSGLGQMRFSTDGGANWTSLKPSPPQNH